MALPERMREDIQRSIRRHRKTLNQLEPHLGCVVCRGPLTAGVCPTCDPSVSDGKGESGG